MQPRGWRTVLIVPARDTSGQSTQVVAGVVTLDGRSLLAIRVGQDGKPAAMGDHSARELVAALQATLDERGRS